jgi:hypothetical protein
MEGQFYLTYESELHNGWLGAWLFFLFKRRELFENTSDKLFKQKMDENDQDCRNKLLN